MGVFRFKKFEVRNELSAMKVNTDGVLLGASATLHNGDRNILDIGTGTGTIALMLAQRYDTLTYAEIDGFQITGIDIDAPSAEEASYNFERSPWRSCLKSIKISLQDYSPEQKIDLIISNPPFFEKDLLAPESRRNAARHGDSSLTYEEIVAFASENLSPEGRLSLIIPSDRCSELVRVSASYGLHPFRILNVRTSTSKPVTRSVVEMSRKKGGVKEEDLSLTEQGSNTSQYLSLVSEFYISTN